MNHYVGPRTESTTFVGAKSVLKLPIESLLLLFLSVYVFVCTCAHALTHKDLYAGKKTCVQVSSEASGVVFPCRYSYRWL